MPKLEIIPKEIQLWKVKLYALGVENYALRASYTMVRVQMNYAKSAVIWSTGKMYKSIKLIKVDKKLPVNSPDKYILIKKCIDNINPAEIRDS